MLLIQIIWLYHHDKHLRLHSASNSKSKQNLFEHRAICFIILHHQQTYYVCVMAPKVDEKLMSNFWRNCDASAAYTAANLIRIASEYDGVASYLFGETDIRGKPI